jgi:25S rRNA (adenine2142-N1)-methyltransferase
MARHRKTIRRKKPLTSRENTGSITRKEAIRSLHTQLKMGQGPSVPLSVYQNASSRGQDLQRGGDSSRELVKWLDGAAVPIDLRVLEIGCLETDNAIAKYVETRQKTIRRIDLKSRDPRIEEQDFMTMSVPGVLEVLYQNSVLT